MKLKKLCTTLTILAAISISGCSPKVDEAIDSSNTLSPEVKDKLNNLATAINENDLTEEEINEKLSILEESLKDSATTNTDNVSEVDDTKKNEKTDSSSNDNQDENNTNEYFYRIYGSYKDNLDEIKKKNDASSDKDTLSIYDHNAADTPDDFYSIGTVDVSKDLSLKEKLTLLCAKMEEVYKTEDAEIAIEIEDCIDDKIAVVSIVEKYPMHNYMNRAARLRYTLNQPKNQNVDWFDSVVVVYDSGASQ